MHRFIGFALCFASAVAGAQEFPKLKPGLWEMSTTTTRQDGGATKTISMCLDSSVQQEMFRVSTGMMAGMCSKHDLKVSANRVTSVASCEMAGSRIDARSVMTLTGDTAYRTETHATFDPPFMGAKESTTRLEGRHIGACKPGQKPGDMIMPGGQTVNVRQFMGHKG